MVKRLLAGSRRLSPPFCAGAFSEQRAAGLAFLIRDWMQFISPEMLKAPDVIISDLRLVWQTDDDEWLIRFHYVNGADSGYEVEFVDLDEGKLVVRRDSYSAL